MSFPGPCEDGEVGKQQRAREFPSGRADAERDSVGSSRSHEEGELLCFPPGLSTRRAARALPCDTFWSASPLVDLERGFCRGNRPGVRSKPWLKTNPLETRGGDGVTLKICSLSQPRTSLPGSRVEQGRHFSFKPFLLFFECCS